MIIPRLSISELKVAIVAAVACAGLYYGMSARTDEAGRKADELNRRVDKLETSMTAQNAETRGAMTLGFDLMGKKIEAFPIFSEKLGQIERILSSLAARQDQQAATISAVDRAAYEATGATKRLEGRLDKLEADLSRPAPVRATR